MGGRCVWRPGRSHGASSAGVSSSSSGGSLGLRCPARAAAKEAAEPAGLGRAARRAGAGVGQGTPGLLDGPSNPPKRRWRGCWLGQASRGQQGAAAGRSGPGAGQQAAGEGGRGQRGERFGWVGSAWARLRGLPGTAAPFLSCQQVEKGGGSPASGGGTQRREGGRQRRHGSNARRGEGQECNGLRWLLALVRCWRGRAAAARTSLPPLPPSTLTPPARCCCCVCGMHLCGVMERSGQGVVLNNTSCFLVFGGGGL